MCNFADAFNIENVVAWVGQYFAVEQLGVRLYCCLPLIEIVWVFNERDIDAQLWQRVVKQVVGAAVQTWRCNDV